jgi:chromosomal replication initiator protein
MSETWSKALEILKARLDPVQFETWLSPIRTHAGQEGGLTLEVPDEFSARWIRDNYLEMIKDALWDTARGPVGIDFRVRETPDAARPAATPTDAPAVEPTPSDTLVSRFTFDQFVVAPSNEIAHSASELVASAPGTSYNPLFLYGGVGVGKTHLVHGIGHALRARFPRLRMVYTFGESYVNEVMTAGRNGRLDLLRHRYRGQCDVLLMDDIQYLSHKEFAQEEFFHTFNELYNAGKQIVVTSDQSPKKIPGITERLRSRFEWGLLVDIAPPEPELRVQILLRKAGREGIALPVEVAEFLAQRFSSSVRELEGALNRVAAHAMIRKVPLTLDMARRVTDGIVTDRRGHLGAETVLKVVSDYFGLQVGDLKSPRRHQAVSVPRQIAMHLLRERTGASLPAIGAVFGGRSHTTVLASLRRIQDLMETESATERAVRDIERQLGF